MEGERDPVGEDEGREEGEKQGEGEGDHPSEARMRRGKEREGEGGREGEKGGRTLGGRTLGSEEEAGWNLAQGQTGKGGGPRRRVDPSTRADAFSLRWRWIRRHVHRVSVEGRATR